MSVEKAMNDLEQHIDYVSSYFGDVQEQLGALEKDYIDEIHELKKDVETISEQNELLEEQVEDLRKENSLLNLENIELSLKVDMYERTRKAYVLDL